MTSPQRKNNHAAQMLQKGLWQTALPLLEQAARDDPNPVFLTNLAVAYKDAGRFQESSVIIDRVLELDENEVGAWHALGMLCLTVGRYEEALRCFTKVCNLQPDSLHARFERTVSLLTLGDWDEGWREYELRRQYKPERTFPSSLPRWDGTPQHHVFCWAEQGYGDTIQFSRYIALLAKAADKVTFAVPADLLELFSGFSDVVELVALGPVPTGVTCEVALMSLPMYFKSTPQSVPPDPGFMAKGLGRSVATHACPKHIGLCWSGSQLYVRAKEKSVPFEQLICAVGGVDARFTSLQVGPQSQDIAKARAQMLVTDLSSMLEGDWPVTAGVICDCDLVITVDTAVAHLAGSLGIPTWLLLSTTDIWRWFALRTDSPWYPSMEIFRQQTPGDWSVPLAQVRARLDTLHAAQAPVPR